MPQRDIESKIVFLDPQTLTMDSTGDDDIATGIDVAGARAGGFVITAMGATLTTQVSYLEILEATTLGGTYTPVGNANEDAANRQLPTNLNTEYETDQYGQLLVNPNSGYRQQIGFFGTHRYVKLRAHTDSSQGSVALTVQPFLIMEEKPTLELWHPTASVPGDSRP